ncbi:hypothetical protein [Bacillus sp. SG-1]|uniref:hypothetical protein n=1 Tax=Bacillus sp. SG-1 TaxID=161544 RepID=UPI0002EA71B7|nr:hypothetical protein [Bacillus sp. SG-1]
MRDNEDKPQPNTYPKENPPSFPPFEFIQKNPEFQPKKRNAEDVGYLQANAKDKKYLPQNEIYRQPDLTETIRREIKNQLYSGLLREVSITISKELAGMTQEKLAEEIQKKLKDLPFNINLNLNIHQQQNPEQISVGHVNHGAVAIKDSNAVDNPVNSSVAQAHSNASDNPKNSSVAQEHSASSDNPSNSAVALDKSKASDNPSNSAVAMEKSNASDNPSESPVAQEQSNSSDNPDFSTINQVDPNK